MIVGLPLPPVSLQKRNLSRGVEFIYPRLLTITSLQAKAPPPRSCLKTLRLRHSMQ